MLAVEDPPVSPLALIECSVSLLVLTEDSAVSLLTPVWPSPRPRLLPLRDSAYSFAALKEADLLYGSPPDR